MEITEKVLEAIKNAAHKATFEELYMHEVRHGSGVVDWDLSTCESDDEDADGDSIARIYDRRNINYFIEMTPERAIALVAEIERQREEIAALWSVINDIERAVINETVNPPKLQSWIVHRIHALTPEPAPVEADTDVYKYHAYLVEATAANAKPLTLSQWLQFHGNTATPVETAPAPEPAPEIKKGDKVGVIRAHGHSDKQLIGLEGVVTEIREGEELTYRYTVKIGERRHFLARDQIIPLSAD